MSLRFSTLFQININMKTETVEVRKGAIYNPVKEVSAPNSAGMVPESKLEPNFL